MARSKRWTIPFVSLNGTSCHVDIYCEGTYSTTTLTGAPNPIEWQENDDDSLLKVVRTKTGYIRVVEENFGDLIDLYPDTDIDHYIEFYYGSDLYFTGYMQAQQFDSDWAPGPRVIDFPIQSPLAVAQGLHFTAPANAGFTNIGTLLKEACNTLNAGITHVIFPDGIEINNVDFDVLWRMSTLVCCPFNEDFSMAYGSSEPLYQPLTIYEFIEGLCNCLGLMAHDVAGYLVFSRFDYMDTYYDYLVSNLDTLQPETGGMPSLPGDRTFDYSSVSILGTNNHSREIRPLKKLVINYDGDFFEDEGVAFNHARLYNPVGTNADFATLYPVGDEVDSDYMIYTFPTGSGDGVWMGAYTEEMRECFIVSAMSGWSDGTKILRIRYLVPPKNGGFTVRIPISQGADLDEGGTISVGIIVKNGTNYYDASDGQHVWGSSEVVNVVTRMDSHNDLVLNVDRAVPIANLPLDIILTYQTDHAVVGRYMIEDVKVIQGDTPSSTYGQNADEKKRKVLQSDNGSNVEDSISMLFNAAVKNKTMVLPVDANGYRDGQMPCQYAYMFQAQHRVSVQTFIAQSPTLYTRLATFFVSGWHWRITAISFDPWNDTMQVTFHHSSLI